MASYIRPDIHSEVGFKSRTGAQKWVLLNYKPSEAGRLFSGGGEELTWCSLRDMRIPGTTTFLRSSISAKIHSSLTEEMRKSPLKSACRPYRKDSKLLSGERGREEDAKEREITHHLRNEPSKQH